MSDPQAGSIYPDKAKLLFVSVCAFLAAAAAGALAVYAQALRISIGGAIVLDICIVFFGFSFLYSAYRLIFSKPLISIDKDGIVDNTGVCAVGRIKWDEIDSIGINRFLNLTFVGITPKDLHAVISRQNVFKRWFLQLNKLLTAMPINISEFFLPMSAQQLLLKIQEFQSQSSTQYILTDTVPRPAKKSAASRMRLLAGITMAAVILGVTVFCLFRISKSSFSLQMRPGEGAITFSTLNLGGYRFIIDDDWANTSNKRTSTLVKGELYNDVYFMMKGKPWELWLNVRKSKGGPASTDAAKQRMVKELKIKKVSITKILDEKVRIGGQDCVLSSIFLKNGQILSIAALEKAGFSIAGFLAYDSGHLFLIKDLATVMETFQTLSTGR